jgi:hypothetical protein
MPPDRSAPGVAGEPAQGLDVPRRGWSEAPQTAPDPGNRVTYRCPGPDLRTNVAVTDRETRGTAMTLHYSSPALDAELAYRREILMASGSATRTRPGRWSRSRRRQR